MRAVEEKVRLGGVFGLECWRPYGPANLSPEVRQWCYDHGKLFHRRVWSAEAENLVVNAGLQHILDVVFSAASNVATWYVGLTDDTPTVAAADTLASHAGWVEFTEYTGDRQAWVEVRSGQSMTNSASVASFPITAAGGGLGGAFICSVATTTTGTLMCGAALSGGNRVVANGDTVEVTYTFSAADDGA